MDWKLLIAELQAGGLTQPQIAARCGCAQATISDLASGTTGNPRYPLGEALRALAEERRAHKAEAVLIATPSYAGPDRRIAKRAR